MTVEQIPKYWIFGRNMDVSDGNYGLPKEHNLPRWRKINACINCEKRKCKQRMNRSRFLKKTPAFIIPLLFLVRLFHCGKKWQEGK